MKKILLTVLLISTASVADRKDCKRALKYAYQNDSSRNYNGMKMLENQKSMEMRRIIASYIRESHINAEKKCSNGMWERVMKGGNKHAGQLIKNEERLIELGLWQDGVLLKFAEKK